MGHTRDYSESVFSILVTSVFEFHFLKQLLLRNCGVDFVEICNVYIGKMIIKAAKGIFNSDKICRSYSDLNFYRHFFGTQCIVNRQVGVTEFKYWVIDDTLFTGHVTQPNVGPTIS